MRRNLMVLVIASVLTSGPAAGIANPGYHEYANWLGWATIRPGERAGLASSYDRAGGNFDFSHYENTDGTCPNTTDTCRNAGPVTVATLAGPGVIHRFWMPHFTSNQVFAVRMFFDGEATPRIDTTSVDLLNGNFGYFQAPLVNTFAGGQVCYEPIPFAGTLRIETVNHALPPSGYSQHNHYYQYTYSLCRAGTPVSSYSGSLSANEQTERAAMVTMFQNAGEHPAGTNPAAVVVTTPATVIPGGQAISLASLAGPGVVRRLNVRMDNATDAELHALRLRVRYDGEATPGIDIPVDDFFGAGHQRTAYQSLPLGTDSTDGFYCYWPMPYRQAILVELFNSGGSGVAIDGATVEYQSQALDPYACYLRAQTNSTVVNAATVHLPMAAATGHGHYVGNLLYVHQFSDNFFMLEGDEIVTVDGTDVLYGTGLEDAYNGGYYYNWAVGLTDEPEGAFPPSAIRPLNGILHVSRTPGVEARADQYRWQIVDRVPFTQSLDVRIEAFYSTFGAIWTSVAFWYQWPTGWIAADGDVNLDGQTDGDDIAIFLALLTSGSVEDPIRVAHGDYNTSGVIDGGDAAGFVAGLLN